MSEYGFLMIRIIPYKDRIIGSALIWGNKGQAQPVFWHILRNVVADL